MNEKMQAQSFLKEFFDVIAGKSHAEGAENAVRSVENVLRPPRTPCERKIRFEHFHDRIASPTVSDSPSPVTRYYKCQTQVEFRKDRKGATTMKMWRTGLVGLVLGISGFAIGGPLKIVGAVAPKGEKIRIEIPEFRGVYKILDLRQATGVTEEDFELVTTTKPPVFLRLVNGYLSAVHSTGTTLFLR